MEKGCENEHKYYKLFVEKLLYADIIKREKMNCQCSENKQITPDKCKNNLSRNQDGGVAMTSSASKRSIRLYCTVLSFI